MHADKRR